MAAAAARAFRKPMDASADDSWKKELKRMIFQHSEDNLLQELRQSPEKILFTATLMLEEDYRLSAGWALMNSAAQGIDITVAKPYLTEGMQVGDKNQKCLCARALTHHYLNIGDRPGLDSVAETDDAFVRRDFFDTLNARANEAHVGAIDFLIGRLGHADRALHDLAASALELAVELGSRDARDLIRAGIESLRSDSDVTNLMAFRASEKISRSLELREKRQG